MEKKGTVIDEMLPKENLKIDLKCCTEMYLLSSLLPKRSSSLEDAKTFFDTFAIYSISLCVKLAFVQFTKALITLKSWGLLRGALQYSVRCKLTRRYFSVKSEFY